MNVSRRTRELLQDAFPSIWIRWHFMRCPKSEKQELACLDRVVPDGSVTVDVGANCGLYTRRLSRVSRRVHAFEPSHRMAKLLRRTSASNVSVHEVALSDQIGGAELFTPRDDDRLIHSLASLEPRRGSQVVSTTVPTAKLDAIVHEEVGFVKIDVEGHELNVLNGAVELLEHSQPVFLVEAEERHREQATRLLFEFFREKSYRGYFLKDGGAYPVEQFSAEELQDAAALLPDGSRKAGKAYVNNFFFFPPHMDGASILNN